MVTKVLSLRSRASEARFAAEEPVQSICSVIGTQREKVKIGHILIPQYCL